MSSTKSKNPVVSTLCGAIAGGIEATAVWPMEYIKTQLQLQERALKTGGTPPKYTGMISGIRWHVKNGGFFSLYRGLAPVVLGSIPKAGIRFGGFEYVKRILTDEDGKITPMKNLVAGMTAGAIEAVVAVTPIETVKTRLIDGNSGILQGVKRILVNEGISGLYLGVTATVLKQASNQGLRFMWFSEYKQRIPKILEDIGIVNNYGELNDYQLALVNLFGGMSAGCFSTLGNNPFDVCKTKMQGLDAAKYKSTLDCAMHMLKTDGPSAFYAGLIPRLSRVIPGQGIIFMSYESISSTLSSIVEN